jgi:hypothetical protein
MMASFQRNGRVMIPIRVASPIKQVRPVFQISGTEKKKNMMVVRLLLLIDEVSFTRYQTGDAFQLTKWWFSVAFFHS